MSNRLRVLTALGCLAISGCGSTTAGTAAPAARVSPTTADTLPKLLLSTAEVGAAMGDDALAVAGEVSAPWNDAAHFLGRDERGCLAIAGAAQKGVYFDVGWTAMRGQVLREPPTAAAWSHFATQAVVLFANAQAAGRFLARSSSDWAGCSNRELDYRQQLAPDQMWLVGPVTANTHMLTLSREQRSPQRWSCQRALAVRANVAVDVEACNLGGPTTAAGTIAEAIVDRLPAA